MEIKCKQGFDLKLNQLIPFQGDLKDLSKDNYEKLKAQMLDKGFIAPFHVWVDEIFGTRKYYILDGHQRLRVLNKMKKEGIEIPDKFPTIEVEANTAKQAKEIVLALTSQYGNMTKDGLYELMNGSGIEFDELAAFRFPEIKLEDLAKEFFVDDVEKNIMNEEKKMKECPKCGHSW